MEIQFDALRKACLPFVKKLVVITGGTTEDAEEVLSDAFCIYLTKGQIKKKAQPKTFVCAIAKRLWQKELRRRSIAQKHSRKFCWHNEQEESATCVEEAELVLCAFERLAEDRTKQILTAFYIEKMSMAEIARCFGFPSENAARKQKFHALNNVRTLLRNELPHVFQAA
jgi:RNA polymerase sigma factor (sigma-70 family)